jgi:hypothetical protein
MKTLALALTLLALSTMPAKAAENAFFTLKSSATTTGAYGQIRPVGSKVAFQAAGRTTSGAGAATIVIVGSLNGTDYVTLGTITLTLGTAITSDGFTSDNAWVYYSSTITAISGTNAVASVFVGSKQ